MAEISKSLPRECVMNYQLLDGSTGAGCAAGLVTHRFLNK